MQVPDYLNRVKAHRNKFNCGLIEACKAVKMSYAFELLVKIEDINVKAFCTFLLMNKDDM